MRSHLIIISRVCVYDMHACVLARFGFYPKKNPENLKTKKKLSHHHVHQQRRTPTPRPPPNAVVNMNDDNSNATSNSNGRHYNICLLDTLDIYTQARGIQYFSGSLSHWRHLRRHTHTHVYECEGYTHAYAPYNNTLYCLEPTRKRRQ